MRLYQFNAFTDRLFVGNPVTVVPLTDWLPTSGNSIVVLR
jgi:predicted PhzF superfamily epimerase YddE/YHI9